MQYHGGDPVSALEMSNVGNNMRKAQRKRSSTSSDVFNEAILEEDFAKVKILLKYGGKCIRLNEENDLGLNALQQSCLKGNLNLVMLLLDNGAGMELKDSNGWTALHFAVAAGKCNVARFLINSCADLTAMSTDGQLPIDLAQSNEMILLLAKAMERAGYQQTASLYREKSGLEPSFVADDEVFLADIEDVDIIISSDEESAMSWSIKTLLTF